MPCGGMWFLLYCRGVVEQWFREQGQGGAD